MSEPVERDLLLDQLRGFGMAWVVVVHTLYHLDVWPYPPQSTVKSFLLLEMPLMFFVTGAAAMRAKKRPYFTNLVRRVVPFTLCFWAFGALVLLINYLFFVRMGPIDMNSFGQMALTWVNPFGTPVSWVRGLEWAMWYVSVYLVLCLAIDPLSRLRTRSKAVQHATTAVLCVLFLVSLHTTELVQRVAFYALWIWAGTLWPTLKDGLLSGAYARVLATVVVSGIAVLALASGLGYDIDMQVNKFPPNVWFAFFSLTAMSLLGLVLPLLARLFDALERWSFTRFVALLYQRRSLPIYFLHVLLFCAIYYVVVEPGVLFGVPDLAKELLYLVLCLPGCALFGLVFGPMAHLSQEQGGDGLAHEGSTLL